MAFSTLKKLWLRLPTLSSSWLSDCTLLASTFWTVTCRKHNKRWDYLTLTDAIYLCAARLFISFSRVVNGWLAGHCSFCHTPCFSLINVVCAGISHGLSLSPPLSVLTGAGVDVCSFSSILNIENGEFTVPLFLSSPIQAWSKRSTSASRWPMNTCYCQEELGRECWISTLKISGNTPRVSTLIWTLPCWSRPSNCTTATSQSPWTWDTRRRATRGSASGSATPTSCQGGIFAARRRMVCLLRMMRRKQEK